MHDLDTHMGRTEKMIPALEEVEQEGKGFTLLAKEFGHIARRLEEEKQLRDGNNRQLTSLIELMVLVYYYFYLISTPRLPVRNKDPLFWTPYKHINRHGPCPQKLTIPH